MEAPYLSRLEERYKARGLQVIAVDAEDRDTREMAAEFARKQRTTHTILVGGSEAADRYAFDKVLPTSFWIDDDGRIVRRDTGFRPEMEKELYRTAEVLLKAREASSGAPSSPAGAPNAGGKTEQPEKK